MNNSEELEKLTFHISLQMPDCYPTGYAEFLAQEILSQKNNPKASSPKPAQPRQNNSSCLIRDLLVD